MGVKVQLENFFDMDSEEFYLSTFMIFCGDNGAGKTHLVKYLNAIDNTFRDARKLQNIASLLQKERPNILDDLWNKEGLVSKIEQTNKRSLKNLYNDIAEGLSFMFKKQKKPLLSEYFTEDILDKFGDIKIKFTDIENITIVITEGSEVTNSSKIVASAVEENNEISIFLIDINVGTEKSQTRLRIGGKTGKKDLDVKRYNSIFKRVILRTLIKLIYKVNFPSATSESLYLPASREAYIRDYEYILKNSIGSLSGNGWVDEESVSLYEDDYGRKNHSDDPFIERYIIEIISSNKNQKNEKGEKIANYLENDIMRAKMIVKNGTWKYKLSNGKEIPTIQASSLQNEYSHFTQLIQNGKYKSFVIEEPEAHLSMINSTKFAFVLLSLHQKGYKIWITTHNTFIADTVNNFIMMSKLSLDKQKYFFEKFKISNLIDEIRRDKIEEIQALHLINGNIMNLQKNETGIVFDEFIHQVNEFVDISAELQNEFSDVLLDE